MIMHFHGIFLETYYAFSAYYWIELARHGIDNSWIPFQGMGYPLLYEFTKWILLSNQLDIRIFGHSIYIA